MLNHLRRRLGDRPLPLVQRSDLQALLDSLRETPGTADAVKSAARSMYLWATRRDLVESDPSGSLVVPRRVSRERILSPTEVGDFWNSCTAHSGRSLYPIGLKLVLLTGCRPGEAFGLAESELARESDGLWWTLPAERSKNHDPIRRPLSNLAAGLLDEAREINAQFGHAYRGRERAESGLILDGTRNSWGDWMRDICEGMANRPTAHDLRRTSRTTLSRLGVRFEVAETLLGHRLSGVAAIYDRHGWDPEMREAVEKLADEVQRLAQS